VLHFIARALLTEIGSAGNAMALDNNASSDNNSNSNNSGRVPPDVQMSQLLSLISSFLFDRYELRRCAASAVLCTVCPMPGASPPPVYACDECHVSPIHGVRWHVEPNFDVCS
jgi:hypothetical protein